MAPGARRSAAGAGARVAHARSPRPLTHARAHITPSHVQFLLALRRVALSAPFLTAPQAAGLKAEPYSDCEVDGELPPPPEGEQDGESGADGGGPSGVIDEGGPGDSPSLGPRRARRRSGGGGGGEGGVRWDAWYAARALFLHMRRVADAHARDRSTLHGDAPLWHADTGGREQGAALAERREAVAAYRGPGAVPLHALRPTVFGPLPTAAAVVRVGWGGRGRGGGR